MRFLHKLTPTLLFISLMPSVLAQQRPPIRATCKDPASIDLTTPSAVQSCNWKLWILCTGVAIGACAVPCGAGSVRHVSINHIFSVQVQLWSWMLIRSPQFADPACDACLVALGAIGCLRCVQNGSPGQQLVKEAQTQLLANKTALLNAFENASKALAAEMPTSAQTKLPSSMQVKPASMSATAQAEPGQGKLSPASWDTQ